MTIYVDVKMEQVVICVMDGKNNLIILCTIRLTNVKKKTVERDHARTIIPKNKKE